ncbi:MAG: sigma-70 family RNA polymerase sigma factor [Lachnospiraceae bacterium]|nr:sigma-70 family RNA polymerase sigma factor [Lachnospiraceae bacterium]
MTDDDIVKLYWDREESAIAETSAKYGAYCSSIAINILHNRDDAEECVNDTWLHAWNAMPPQKPSILSAFLGKITRNLSFDLYKKLHREKRGGDGIDLVLDELAEIVSGGEDPADSYDAAELKKDINLFLDSLSDDKRNMFVLRYWYADSVSSIAKRFATSENTISVTLNRLRGNLKTYLTERGYSL